MKARGFTVIEAVVAISISSVILIALWSVMSRSQTLTVDAERRFQAVSVIHRVCALLEADTTRLFAYGDDGGVSVQNGGRAVAFYVVAPGVQYGTETSPIRLRPVFWSFDPQSHRIGRKEGATAATIPGIKLADLRFQMSDRREKYAAGDLPSQLPEVDCLRARIVWVPPEDLAAGRQPEEKDVVSVCVTLGLPHLSDRLRYPGWILNPTSKPKIDNE